MSAPSNEFRQRVRAPVDPYAIYRPENIITAGEVNPKKQPAEWKGWDSINFVGWNLSWPHRRSDYYRPPHIYAGRLIFWQDEDNWVRVTVLRWDSVTKKHVWRGVYKDGYSARMALGSLTYCGH